MTQASRMTIPMEETSGSAMAIMPQINIRMPQTMDHPEAFPVAAAGVIVFMFAFFLSTRFENFSTAMRLLRFAVKEICQATMGVD